MSIEALDLAGSYERSIDYKGRVNIPSKIKPQFLAGCVVGASPKADGEQHLIIIPKKPGWRELAGGILTAEMPEKVRRGLSAYNLNTLVSVRFTAVEVEAQGRITLPMELRKYASLASNEQPENLHTRTLAIINGMGDYGQIWNPDVWRAYYSRLCEETGNWIVPLEVITQSEEVES